MSLPRRPTAEPLQHSRGTRNPVIWATEMLPGLGHPIYPPLALEWAGGLEASVGRTRAVALPLLPSSSRSSRLALLFPNATGLGRGAVAGRARGHTPPGWSRFLGTPSQQRGSLPAGCSPGAPREGLFSAGAGKRAQGAGLPSMCRFLPCSAGSGSWEPGPPLPFPWKLAPALGNALGPQFLPQEAGREGEETSGSLLPD